MLFRPARIVRVTTKQEFDSALGSADQVIVEGDDELLSYAVATASDDPQDHVSIEVGERSISVRDRIVVKGPTAAGDTERIYQEVIGMVSTIRGILHMPVRCRAGETPPWRMPTGRVFATARPMPQTSCVDLEATVLASLAPRSSRPRSLRFYSLC
jgi:hypothetical protein